MKLKLTKREKAELLPHIFRVLKTGEKWEAPTMHHPAGAIIAAVLEIPGMKKGETKPEHSCSDGFDTNGWEWDWWQTFIFKGNEYTLSGSGWLGGHAFFVADY